MFRYSFFTSTLIPSMTLPALLPLRPPMICMPHIQRIVLLSDDIRVLVHLPLGSIPNLYQALWQTKRLQCWLIDDCCLYSVLCYILDMLIKIDASYEHQSKVLHSANATL